MLGLNSPPRKSFDLLPRYHRLADLGERPGTPPWRSGSPLPVPTGLRSASVSLTGHARRDGLSEDTQGKGRFRRTRWPRGGVFLGRGRKRHSTRLLGVAEIKTLWSPFLPGLKAWGCRATGCCEDESRRKCPLFPLHATLLRRLSSAQPFLAERMYWCPTCGRTLPRGVNAH